MCFVWSISEGSVGSEIVWKGCLDVILGSGRMSGPKKFDVREDERPQKIAEGEDELSKTCGTGENERLKNVTVAEDERPKHFGVNERG